MAGDDWRCYQGPWEIDCERNLTPFEREYYRPRFEGWPECLDLARGDANSADYVTFPDFPRLDLTGFDPGRCGEGPWHQVILQRNDESLASIFTAGAIRFGLGVAGALAGAYALDGAGSFSDLLTENLFTDSITPGPEVTPVGLFDDLFGSIGSILPDDFTSFVSGAENFISGFGGNGGAQPPVAYAPTAGSRPPVVSSNVSTSGLGFPGGSMNYGPDYGVMVPYAQVGSAGNVVATIGETAGTMAKYILSIVRQVAPSVTWKKLLSFARMWGAPALVGLGLSSELIQYVMKKAHKKQRRMNPANVKALRRSVRRLQSFDTLACRVSAQLATVAGAGGRRRRGVARGRRCFKCRKSPCSC